MTMWKTEHREKSFNNCGIFFCYGNLEGVTGSEFSRNTVFATMYSWNTRIQGDRLNIH